MQLLVPAGRGRLQKPHDPNVTDVEGNSALAMSSSDDHIEVARLLLEAGANTDCANIRGFTALMIASEEGHVEVARVLQGPYQQ